MTFERGLDYIIDEYMSGDDGHVAHDFILWNEKGDEKTAEESEPVITSIQTIHSEITMIIYTKSAKMNLFTFGYDECKNQTGLKIIEQPNQKIFEMDPGMEF